MAAPSHNLTFFSDTRDSVFFWGGITGMSLNSRSNAIPNTISNRYNWTIVLPAELRFALDLFSRNQ